VTVPDACELALVVTGRRPGHGGVAELWRGSTLVGILHAEPGGAISLRLESHVRGPLTLDARALEAALIAAREQLEPAPARP
jgi:hypothetical protein